MTPDQKKKKASLHMQSACGEASVYIYIYIYEMGSSYTWCNSLELHLF